MPRQYWHFGPGSGEGRPAGRAGRSARGSWWCARRASGRWPDFAPPFSARGAAMSLDRSGVEREHDGIFAELRQSFEDRTPSVTFGPAVEAIVDRRVGAVLRRAIAPAGPRLQHMNDAADDAPIVVARWTRQSGRLMRLDTRPVPVTQPKQTLTHSLAPALPRRQENHGTMIRYRPYTFLAMKQRINYSLTGAIRQIITSRR